MASIFSKITKATKKKIIHSTFNLGHDILTAIEEELVGEEQPSANDSTKPTDIK